ncbi:hypothetical protein HBI16_085800 [Parastagonospora nodorum]|nr:hypothetical protein HBI16_085800 [Parastagonospora nodorum]
MCAKDDLIRRKGPLLTSTQTPNHVNIFSLDFAFSFANILSLIAFIISYRLFADELLVYVTIRNLSCEAQRQRLIPSTLLARFIPITKIRNLLLKKNVAKSRILLACADRRTRQYYLTICAILANYEEQVLLTSVKKNCYYTRCTVAPNDREDLYDIYPSSRKIWDNSTTLVTQESSSTYTEQKAIIQQLIAIVSLLFISKAPFALHFIRAVCDLVTLAQYKSYDEDTLAYIQGALERMNIFKEKFQHALTHIIQDIRMYRALDSICTRANSEAHYITIVKQFYSIINKKDEVTVNIAISNFTHAAAQSSSKRHNDPKHCDEKVLHLILTIINYTCYDKDRKHIAYIRAFSKILLFNNNRQINNTTRILTFKFYDLSTIIRLVHLVLRDLPNLTTYTTISYYVNNYID